MRALRLALALAVVFAGLLGCGPGTTVNTEAPIVMVGEDVSGNSCSAAKYLTGLLIEVPSLGTSIQDDEGVMTHVVWPMYTVGRRLAGGEIELSDNRTRSVVATTGRRYKIGGTDFPSGLGFWACAHVVIPQ